MKPSTLHEPIQQEPNYQEPVKHERLHALDALRAFAMVLGVWLHAALPYVAGIPPFFWAASDTRKSDAIGFSVTMIHSWRMELFFLLSGFFTAMLVIRRGAKSTLFQRFKRIVIPFALAMVIIQPMCAAAWGYGYSTQWGFPARTAIESMIKSSWGISVQGGPAEFGRMWHLWFLYVLCWYISLVIVLHTLCGRPGAKISAFCGSIVSWCFGAWFGFVILAIPVYGLLVLQPLQGPQPLTSLNPNWNTLAYYALPFFAGWVLYPRRESMNLLARRWWVPLSFALSVAIPAYYMATTRIYQFDYSTGQTPTQALFVLAYASRALMTTGFGLGFIGLFSQLLSNPGPRLSKVIRYGSDSAYWVYLAHLPLVALFSIWVLDFDVIPELKMLIVMSASVVVLLVSYHFGVRYTPIGTLLNGKRNRPSKKS